MNNTKTSTPAQRIAEALEAKNMKPSELSEKTGIAKSSISCWINGKYEPKQEALYLMGKVMDVAEMWLAGYDLPMERPDKQKKNDTLTDIVSRLQSDEHFFKVTNTIYLRPPEDLTKIEKMLDALFL